MTYKSTLQEHNAQLQQCNTKLTQAIDKANSLPDAGSGGSGATVETCTGKIEGGSGLGMEGSLYYLDKDLNSQTLEFNLDYGESVSFEVVKNSIMASSDLPFGYTENITPVASFLSNNNPHYYAGIVNGDFTMIVE